MTVKLRATIQVFQRLSCVDNNTISLAAMIQKVSYTDVNFTGLVSSCSNNSCLPCSLHTKRYRPETMIGSVTRIRSDLRLIMHGLIEWTLGFVWSRSMYPLLFRWFKFTPKPPYSIVRGKLWLAIWDTSFWTFWHKFGHKGPWDIS